MKCYVFLYTEIALPWWIVNNRTPVKVVDSLVEEQLGAVGHTWVGNL